MLRTVTSRKAIDSEEPGYYSIALAYVYQRMNGMPSQESFLIQAVACILCDLGHDGELPEIDGKYFMAKEMVFTVPGLHKDLSFTWQIVSELLENTVT